MQLHSSLIPVSYLSFNAAILTYNYLGYRTAAIYSNFTALYSAQPGQPTSNDYDSQMTQSNGSSPGSSRLTEARYTRVRKQLLQMLRHELEVAENVSDHPLHHYDALKAKNELTEQLAQYHLGHPPFRQFTTSDQGALQYWGSHRDSPLAFILAVSFILERIIGSLA